MNSDKKLFRNILVQITIENLSEYVVVQSDYFSKFVKSWLFSSFHINFAHCAKHTSHTKQKKGFWTQYTWDDSSNTTNKLCLPPTCGVISHFFNRILFNTKDWSLCHKIAQQCDVKITRFFCHSDFTWNQFLRM